MRAILFVNGKLDYPQQALSLIRPNDLLIAVDGGALHLQTLGLQPHIVIGDCDSLSRQAVLALEKSGVTFQKHPARKDQTDLELALEYARQQEATEILLLAALGGRWDQTLANILLCFQASLAAIPITIYAGKQKISPIRGTISLQGLPGDTVSLLPVGGDAHGVTSYGLEYPLSDETLVFGSSLGISNTLLDQTATIVVHKGHVLCIHITQTNEEAA